ncbi:AAA family ATPase [Phenylobacterium sp.]|uniref:ATP-dependent nuclease n=1 Tax=Phenylobacterium sp. TaxID=1871053 RepID=UPI002619D95D|nr:AAA family ATPase [Phenylobacterium sp.]
MKLVHARIQNFRSLRDVSVELGAHTALIGGNGAGKSSILKALEKFYQPSRHLEVDDYFGRDTEQSVEIELTFSDLTDEETQVFESRVRDGRLTVARVFDGSSTSGRYHGVVPSEQELNRIRAISAALERRTAYNDLRAQNPRFSGLPVGTSAAQMDAAMNEWEAAHPEALSLQRDDGQFFGFQNASRGALQRFTSFVFVPAVREASVDAADAKASPISQLLELVVRSSILQRADIVQFKEEVNAKFRELTSPDNMPELNALAGRLTNGLRQLYSEAAVGLNWRATGDVPVPLPNAEVSLSDDGFGGPVDRQGHGLQRAFIFTLLQHLAHASRVEPPGDPEEGDGVVAHAPALILAIEEPELYQHPTKQRHLATVLRQLSSGTLPGAEGQTQVVFASHSPMFVSLPNVTEIRFVRRVNCEDVEYKQCDIRGLDMSHIARCLETASQAVPGSFSAESLMPRLHILGPELSEGFFADGVVLVEGASDRAALCAIAAKMGVNFESAGIAILPAGGKNNLDRPAIIFRELGIPVYIIWDCDSDAESFQNLRLLRAVDPSADHLEFQRETVVRGNYAYFAVKLEASLKQEIGNSLYESCLSAACDEFGVPANADAQKSPEIMKRFLELAEQEGATSKTLEHIVDVIWANIRRGPEEAP